MSSSAKRMKKLRKDQTEEEVKAERARNAQRMSEKRAAARNAKIKESQQPDQKSPLESSLLSLGPNDSGFDTMNALEATSLSSQCATSMTPVRGSSFRGLRKESKSTDGKSASTRIDGEDSGFVSMQAMEISNNSLTNCKPLTHNCEINNSQEINKANNEVSFNYKDHASVKCLFFAQHDNRDSQFSCGDAANILDTMRNFHYVDIQNVSYQLRFKRLRAYFSKSSNMLHVSKLK